MYQGVRVAAIAAVAENGVIGINGDLPWHLPDDLRWFKRATKGHAMIMGRKTWQTLPGPLPRRLNIVVSRSTAPVDPAHLGKVLRVTSLDAALSAAATWERAATAGERIQTPEIMIVGGGGLYAAMWPWVDRFYRTRVMVRPAGDAHFPAVALDHFDLVESRPGMSEPAHIFEVWQRRSPANPTVGDGV